MSRTALARAVSWSICCCWLLSTSSSLSLAAVSASLAVTTAGTMTTIFPSTAQHPCPSLRNVLKRYEAYGWATGRVDITTQIETAIAKAQRTITNHHFLQNQNWLGFPSKQGTSGIHGSPMGGIEESRAHLSWAHEPFHIPAEMLHAWRNIGTRNQGESHAWSKRAQQHQTRLILKKH